MLQDDEKLQKGLLLTDNISNLPILDFSSYSNTIVKMIKSSYPNFTIGIFGDWGTGKTTLMNVIKNELLESNENIVIVWFDAWKYENEKEFALIPLLKTINYSIEDKNDTKKRNLKEALKDSAIFTLEVSEDIISSIVTSYAGREAGGLIKKGIGRATSKLIPELKNLKMLSELDKNSIFYNGIKNIQDAIDKIRENNREFRVVIFIDDLDRCSEDKVLEILESMKIFLSLNGFIYIVGLSQDKVIGLINKKYQTKNGEEYLEKFIQIPITLTEWNAKEIVDLIDDLILKNVIHSDYSQIIEENKDIIAYAIEENPRKIKRFLNNLIISYEIFVKVQNIEDEQKKNIFLKQLLLVQILKSNWRNLYRTISNSDGELLMRLQQHIPIKKDKIDTILQEQTIDSQIKWLLEEYKSDEKLWNLFDKNNFDVLVEIDDWSIFRRALKLSDDKQTFSNSKALKLLKNGKIKEFNRLREEGNFNELIFDNVNLRDLDLEGANLIDIDLRNTDLQNTTLYNTQFGSAKLGRANLSSSKLLETSFFRANLFDANFSNVNVNLPPNFFIHYDAGFHADLSGSILNNADFSGAKLSDAIIINPLSYDGLVIDAETDFSNAIIDDSNFIDYLSKYTSKIPQKIYNKKELADEFNRRDFGKKRINLLLQISKLPE